MNNIILKNFKSFKEETINFKKLTVLSGANGAGKSTVIQAILLLIQSRDFFSSDTLTELSLHDYYFDTFYDELLNFDNSQDIEIILDGNSFQLSNSEKNSRIKLKNSAEIENIINFDFIGADRWGPKRFYSNELRYDNRVGKYGENFAKAIGIHEKDVELMDLIDTMLFNVFEEEYKIKITYTRETDTSAIKIGKQNGDKISPIHMPFGVSYILPILSALALALSNDESSLIIIENPEAHLHPQAQSNLGYVLSELSSNPKLQVILETHSDHIINGILRGVKDKKISNEDVLINYFSSKTEFSKVEELNINKNAEIEKWLDGFFDQYSKDVTKLMS